MSMPQQGGGPARPQSGDAEMEQIRELLVGEVSRRSDARLDRLEARLRRLEEEIARGLEGLSARIEAVATEAAAGQRAAFDKLSQGVMELGERIRSLGGGGMAGSDTQ